MNKVENIVSVVVSTYNHADFISRCLDSILMQRTNFVFEIILGEDDSDDGTREICKEYALRYPDTIKLFLRSRKDVIYVHGKPTGRYNFLKNLDECQGKYIALCDGDDYWTDPLKLQKQVDFMEANNEYTICWTGYKIIQDKSVKDPIWYKERNQLESWDVDFNNFSTPYCTMTLTTLFRKECKENFEFPLKSFKYFKDNTLYFLCLSQGKGRFLNFDAARYRLHSGSVFGLQSNYTQSIFNYANYEEVLIKIPKVRVDNIITKRNDWKSVFISELYKRPIPKIKKWIIRLKLEAYFTYLNYRLQ